MWFVLDWCCLWVLVLGLAGFVEVVNLGISWSRWISGFRLFWRFDCALFAQTVLILVFSGI